MMPRVLAAFGMVVLCWFALASATTQNEQSGTSTQTSPTAIHKTSAGTKTLTGCVARENGNFVLKTDEGTYEFNTARDLAPYVGKKVRISGKWSTSGVTTVAPMSATQSSAATTSGATTSGATESAETTKTAAPAKSFVGDLHLHITGDVIGDCAQQ